MPDQIEKYLRENIDKELWIKPWNKTDTLPLILRQQYRFFEMHMLNKEYILLDIIGEHQISINRLVKQVRRIQELSGLQPVYYYRKLSRFRRRTLIENRIPFVIDDGQMFLPFLGLNIDYTLAETVQHVDSFTAAAQLTFAYFLYHKDLELNATELAGKMNFTKMTASRALNKLYALNLLTYHIGGKTGRSKIYRRIADPYYFVIGRRYLSSPVRRVEYTKSDPGKAYIAGLDALAELSMLNPPDHPIRAMGYEQFREEEPELVKNRDMISDVKLTEVQVWDYDPGLLSNTKYVDLISLFSSLKDESDERVELALEEILRGETWYTDEK